ncbi:ankyrin, partial [Parathielavia appendiculata]
MPAGDQTADTREKVVDGSLWDRTQDAIQNDETLQAASFGGHKEIVRMLLEKGADVNAQAGFYGHALQAASFEGHKEIVRMLLDKGADVNAQGGRYGSALQAASSRGYDEVVWMLLEN